MPAAHFDLAHVADIEYPDAFPHGVMFLDDAFILDGHVPAAEVHHFCAHAAMHGVQGVTRRAGTAGMKTQANSTGWGCQFTRTMPGQWVMV